MLKQPCIVTILVFIIMLPNSGAAQHTMEHDSTAERPAGQMMGQVMVGEMAGMMSLMNQMVRQEWDLYLRHREDLGLTEDQIEEFQDIRIEYLRETNDVRGELEIATQELEDMLLSDEYNVNEASRKISDVHDLVVEIEVAQVSYSADARELLTAGQREQARELRQRARRPMMMDGQMMRGRMR